MISYAHNHEDVLLARALAGDEAGFYIDVGAFDPTQASVTRHFYDLGWHGINIEPQPAYAAKLRDSRPRDITLEVAVSDHRGSATLYDVTMGAGVATMDEVHASRLRAQGKICGESQVAVTTLAEITSEHCTRDTRVSFLKVDVEGHERAVLAGADWARCQPRVVVVEATEPMTTTPSHEPWEPILRTAGYVFVQFDGLNRWYAHTDENRLIELLSVPVNALDEYAPYVWVARVSALEDEVASLTDQLADATAKPRQRESLIQLFEELQQRYQRLSDALESERAMRAIESERIARLREAVQSLQTQTPG